MLALRSLLAVSLVTATALLPACTGGAGGADPSDGGTSGGGDGGAGTSAAFLVDPALETSTPQLARDDSGALHLLAASETAGADGKLRVRYGRCASACESAASWSFLTLDDAGASGSEVKLAVEGGGRIHVVELLKGATPVIRYGRCASSCTSATSWAFVDVSPPASVTVTGLPRGRAFAVTATGQPRVLLRGQTNAGPHVLLLGCDGTCIDGAGWRVDPLVYGEAVSASMTSAGDAHQAVIYATPGTQLHFAQCSSACADAASWTSAPVLDGNPYALGLARATSGELHLAYTRSTGSADDLVYARCTNQCTVAASWSSVTVGNGDNGRGGLDLAVSSTGSLAIAGATVPKDVQQVSWLLCDGNCGQATSWRQALLEEGANVSDAHPAQQGAACDASQTLRFWAVGNSVQLLAAPGGKWLFAYDAVSYAQCKSSTTSYVSGRFARLGWK